MPAPTNGTNFGTLFVICFAGNKNRKFMTNQNTPLKEVAKIQRIRKIAIKAIIIYCLFVIGSMLYLYITMHKIEALGFMLFVVAITILLIYIYKSL